MDRRVYNGCPSSEFQKHLNEIEKAVNWISRQVKKLAPDARCVYFPMEERYQIFTNNQPIGKFVYDRFDAWKTALKELKGVIS